MLPANATSCARGKRPVGGKAAWSYTLDEPQQGRVAAAFVVGNTFYCADAPGKTDRVDKFLAQPNTPAPPFRPGP